MTGRVPLLSPSPPGRDTRYRRGSPGIPRASFLGGTGYIQKQWGPCKGRPGRGGLSCTHRDTHARDDRSHPTGLPPVLGRQDHVSRLVPKHPQRLQHEHRKPTAGEQEAVASQEGCGKGARLKTHFDTQQSQSCTFRGNFQENRHVLKVSLETLMSRETEGQTGRA